jgi:hypothetical protein
MADLEGAKANALGWYQSIQEIIERLNLNNGDEHRETVETEIHEGPLSVMVRDGWRQPGGQVGPNPEPAEEFEILLTTGGPALRIWGTLKNGEPDECELQMQDWGTPWTKWVPEPYDPEYRDTLRAYAACFYFGD